MDLKVTDLSNIDDRRYCYICEGVTDEERLKKLGCLFVIKTGGKYIRPEIIKFIENVSKVRKLVIITDPDRPGKYIEERILKVAKESLVVSIPKSKAIKGNKLGVAQMSLEDLKPILKPYILHDISVDENLSLEDEDFIDLGLSGVNSKAKRQILINKYSIPYSSSKTVLDAILMLGLTKTEIERDLIDNDWKE